ncbi:hypothetical protein LUZ60_008158 [Juncus effusus]|nr:hypothetical protein LUZ60_008158 [Juncus effusus]
MPTITEGTAPVSFFRRILFKVSRSRWFIFLRQVYRYQNGSGPGSRLGSEMASNPFNSPGWIALELTIILTQVTVITLVMAISQHERPSWPLRIWVSTYNIGNLLSLPLLYWRHQYANSYTVDMEQQGRTGEPRSSSYLLSRSRSFLELFFATWFVMGNVWMFDSRLGTFNQAPKLHALCVGLLAWNAVLYSLPFLLFLLLCCFVPFVSYVLGCNMFSASVDKAASDEQLSELPHWRYKGLDITGRNEEEHTECCICLTKYEESDEMRQLPCSHMFHLSCVDRWLRIISSCPLCKQELK